MAAPHRPGAPCVFDAARRHDHHLSALSSRDVMGQAKGIRHDVVLMSYRAPQLGGDEGLKQWALPAMTATVVWPTSRTR